MQTYLLTETQQQQFSLNDTDVQQLIQLAQQLASDLSSDYTIEWVFCQSDTNTAPQLYITFVRTREEFSFCRRCVEQATAIPSSAISTLDYGGSTFYLVSFT